MNGNGNMKKPGEHLLTLELQMYDCKNQNGRDKLEKILTATSKIIYTYKNEKGYCYTLEHGDSHIYFMNNTVFELTSYMTNPITRVHKVVNLYLPKYGNGALFCNQKEGLKFPYNEVLSDINYSYGGITHTSQDSTEFKFSERNFNDKKNSLFKQFEEKLLENGDRQKSLSDFKGYIGRNLFATAEEKKELFDELDLMIK